MNLLPQIFRPHPKPNEPDMTPMGETSAGLLSWAELCRAKGGKVGEMTHAVCAKASEVMGMYEWLNRHYRTQTMGFLMYLRDSVQAGKVAMTEAEFSELKWLISMGQGFDPHSKQFTQDLSDLVREHQPDLVVIDPITGTAEGGR